jgi:hypothetical protein
VFGRNFSPISGLNVRCVATWFSSHVLPRYRSGHVSPYPATLSPFWFDRAYRPHASSDRAALACLAHTLGTDPVLNQVANRDRKPGAGVGDTVRATSPEMGCFAKADCVPYVATWFGSHVLPRYRSGRVSPYPATLSPFGFDRAYWPNASCDRAALACLAHTSYLAIARDVYRPTPRRFRSLGSIERTGQMQVAGRAALTCPLVALAKEEACEERAGESG